MTGELSRFTSDRRSPGDTSWSESADWEAGTAENVDVVESGLVPRVSPQRSDLLNHVTDRFEDGSLSEYTVDSNMDHGGASVLQTAEAFEGDRVVKLVSNGRVFALSSTSGLPTYPSVGDTPTFHVLFPNRDDNALYLYYGVQAENGPNRSGYRVTIRNMDNSMRLDNRNSMDLVANGGTQDIPSNEWLQVQIGWRADGGHLVSVFDSSGTLLGSISGSDGGLVSGGIGYGLNNRNGNQSVAYVDLVGYNPS